MSQLSTDPVYKRPDETIRVDIDASQYGLADAELVTGDPVATCSSAEIEASEPAINSSVFKNRKRGDVAIGKGIQFTISGGVAGTSYYVDLSFQTDGSPAQSPSVRIPVYVRNA